MCIILFVVHAGSLLDLYRYFSRLLTVLVQNCILKSEIGPLPIGNIRLVSLKP